MPLHVRPVSAGAVVGPTAVRQLRALVGPACSVKRRAWRAPALDLAAPMRTDALS
jgi:hypothetical protein